MNEEGRGFVVAPLALFEVEFEIGFDAVELGQASFRKAPEGFDPVDSRCPMPTYPTETSPTIFGQSACPRRVESFFN